MIAHIDCLYFGMSNNLEERKRTRTHTHTHCEVSYSACLKNPSCITGFVVCLVFMIFIFLNLGSTATRSCWLSGPTPGHDVRAGLSLQLLKAKCSGGLVGVELLSEPRPLIWQDHLIMRQTNHRFFSSPSTSGLVSSFRGARVESLRSVNCFPRHY